LTPFEKLDEELAELRRRVAATRSIELLDALVKVEVCLSVGVARQ
jgi:hypothetical protein